jgi:hypothetical protein
VDKVWNPSPDGLVGGQLGLGVELELAPGPAKRADDRVVARPSVALRVEQVAEQKVERGRLPVAIT